MIKQANAGQQPADSSQTGPSLLELSEAMANISLTHLTPATRESLRHNMLSINAYPTAHGGLVYIGTPCHRPPAEPDLARIAAVAEQAGVHWILFDDESPVVRDLPVYDADPSCRRATRLAHQG